MESLGLLLPRDPVLCFPACSCRHSTGALESLREILPGPASKEPTKKECGNVHPTQGVVSQFLNIAVKTNA